MGNGLNESREDFIGPRVANALGNAFAIYDLQSPRGLGGGLDKSAAFARRALRKCGTEASIYDMGVRRLRRELDKREGFLRSVIMMTVCCHDF